MQNFITGWLLNQEERIQQAREDLANAFAYVEMSSSSGLEIALRCCSEVGFHAVSTHTVTRLFGSAERLVTRSSGHRPHLEKLFADGDIRAVLMGPFGPATREACARMCLACRGVHRGVTFEVGRWSRLRQALRPYVMAIKQRACASLDAPGIGKRFSREHGPIMDAL
jgi:hypothetical protein